MPSRGSKPSECTDSMGDKSGTKHQAVGVKADVPPADSSAEPFVGEDKNKNYNEREEETAPFSRAFGCC